MAQFRVQTSESLFLPSMVLFFALAGVVSLFLRLLLGRSVTESMFWCHVSFERIFGTLLRKRQNSLTSAVAVTSFHGLLACLPWQASSGLVLESTRAGSRGWLSILSKTRTNPSFFGCFFVHFSGSYLYDFLTV